MFFLLGSAAGILAGLLPGVGVLVSMILLYPIIHTAETHQIILCYMSVAAIVQFVGTIPSVYIGIPGETNSMPALVEGAKFMRHNRSNLAVGMCACASLLGSTIVVLIFIVLSSVFLDLFSVVISTSFKAILFSAVILLLIVVYNNHKWQINLLLIAFGILIGLVGESSVFNYSYLDFGVESLSTGFGLVPVICGLLVPSALFQQYSRSANAHSAQLKITQPLLAMVKHYTSVLRGSIIGTFCGLVPGVTTILSSNASYACESKLHPNSPSKKIIAAESANNSGQFSSMLPLLLFGIPITGSEILLYDMLINSGWAENQFTRIDENIEFVYQLLPWFVAVNLLGLIISWPLSKQLLIIYKLPTHFITTIVLLCIVCICAYVGNLQLQSMSYVVQFLCFACIGLALRKYNLLPAVFAFLLATELEGIYYRVYLFHF